jgi:hypothetical protein
MQGVYSIFRAFTLHVEQAKIPKVSSLTPSVDDQSIERDLPNPAARLFRAAQVLTGDDDAQIGA